MWWLKLASAFKSFWPQIAIAGGVVAALTFAYNLGGDNREAELRSQLTAQYSALYAEQTAEAEAAHNKALSIVEADAAASIESLRAQLFLEQQKKRQVKYVEKIIIDPNCKRLALGVIRLFQHPAVTDSE